MAQAILHGNCVDISGKRFGRLIAQRYQGGSKWSCLCDCGRTTLVKTAKLINGSTKSCRCLNRDLISARCSKDIQGMRFGRLVVVRRIGSRFFWKGGKAIMWECQCDCGSRTSTFTASLIGGNTTSCGCRADELMATIGDRIRTHGMTGTTEYKTWYGIHNRCYNPNDQRYDQYGGRGIKVCDRWRESFDNFFADMGRKPSWEHSIDRIDPNGDYTPENCRWATLEQQANNKRSNRFLSHNGETLTVAQWGRRIGMGVSTLMARINAGWPVEDALTKPLGHIRRKRAKHRTE